MWVLRLNLFHKAVVILLAAVCIVSINKFDNVIAQGFDPRCENACRPGGGGGARGFGTPCTTADQCNATAPVCFQGNSDGTSYCISAQACLYSCNLTARYGNLPNTAAYNYTDKVNAYNYTSMTCAIAGNCGPGSGNSIGAVPTLLGMMQTTLNERPASTAVYIADLKKNMGVPSAYAQGTQGAFSQLNPILNLWKTTRNIALAGFAIIFIVIGIMIMLRKRLDPRTVVTIQQSLPNIIIALIMVIFSYAIISFLIDLVSVGSRVIAQALQSANYIAYSEDPNEKKKLLDNLFQLDVFGLANQVYQVDELIAGFSALPLSLNKVNWFLKGTSSLLGGALPRLVFWVVMFIALIRTFFMLLTSYLAVTVSIILAPFQFLFYSLPGQSGKWEDWFRNLLSHLLVFPAVFFMFAFAAIFYAQPYNGNVVWWETDPTFSQSDVGNVWRVGPTNGENGTTFWNTDPNSSPTSTGYWTPPAIGNWGGLVGPLLSVAIFLTTPRAINIVREAIHPKYRASAAEGAATESLQKGAARVPLVGSLTRA